MSNTISDADMSRMAAMMGASGRSLSQADLDCMRIAMAANDKVKAQFEDYFRKQPFPDRGLTRVAFPNADRTALPNIAPCANLGSPVLVGKPDNGERK